ncbi:MAG: hypothetical protein WAX07_04725 [Candidatus Altiarchaeia archaeon]
MKKILLCAAALALLACTGSAVLVELSSDKTELKINETISFQLVVSDGGSVGGGFSVYRKINDTFQQARRTTFTSSCTMCKGTSPLGDLNESTTFIPLHAGDYRAVANYGGVSREINFTVYPLTTTTTPTTSSTTSTKRTTTTTSTTTTTTTTTTSSTTTTTTLPATTTTLPEYGMGNSAVIYFFGILLLIVVLMIPYTRKRS